MTNIAEQTLATIVTNNHFAVPVLEKYDLDFCCKGKRTLAEACTEKGISIEAISEELEKSSLTATTKMPFTEMTAEQLISYILIHHHFYVKQSMPTIIGHLEKVAAKHGDRFPYMAEVLSLFREINDEMTMHMHKEEVILFPRIKEVTAQQEAHQHSNLAPGYIAAPIQVMELEHEHAGDILYKIRSLTNNYTPPEGACTTFQVSLAELKEFEEDLHRHVHLENNLLFPLAEKILTTQINLN
ncbi:MAG: iron-sulfur cluster repair di-iron protein [Chitinophagaceae bacterium]|nr:iron-sulfur cluster repair di-iron protein [Chitinophagaceae bacterium]